MNLLIVVVTAFLSFYASNPAARALMSESAYPSFKDTPDTISILLLGHELTEELANQNFDDSALKGIIDKMFYSADTDGDTLIDKVELALWLHKNDLINKAAEIKGDFSQYDENDDGLVTFQEYGLNGGMDGLSALEFETKFLLDDDKIDVDKMDEDYPMLDRDGSPNASSIIKRLYDIFCVADVNKDKGLNWEEFIVFSYPEEFEEVYTLSTSGQRFRKHDVDKDERYDLKEFTKYYSSHVIITELLPEDYRTPDSMFESCDEDNDGFVTYAECDKCFKGHITIDHFESEWLMEDGDQDGDSKLSREEVLKEFHTMTEDDDYWSYKDEL